MKSFQIISPPNGKSFSIGSVVEASGQHSLELNTSLWAVLRDIYGHYYLQNPPVRLNTDGSWRAQNIHLGHDIIEIIFVSVTKSGHDLFLRKVKDNDWGAFDELPGGTEKLEGVRIDVR